MKVSNGEPESPLQEASIGVPQTPSNNELVLQLASYSSRWPEGQDTVADTVHGCPCAAIICVQLLPRCTPRSLGIGAGFAVVDVLPKQRFQEWALPYLVDTKCENLQQVRVAVGPRAEEFAGIPCHVFKAVVRRAFAACAQRRRNKRKPKPQARLVHLPTVCVAGFETLPSYYALSDIPPRVWARSAM